KNFMVAFFDPRTTIISGSTVSFAPRNHFVVMLPSKKHLVLNCEYVINGSSYPPCENGGGGDCDVYNEILSVDSPGGYDSIPGFGECYNYDTTHVICGYDQYTWSLHC